MVEGKPISIGNVAYVLGIRAKKIHRWYQHTLSGYTEALTSGEIGKHDFESTEDGKEVKVPILEPKNLGEHMAVDEKTIDGVCYTLLSNRTTNKIALMASTLKASDLLMLMALYFDISERMKVKSLTRDMAQNYDWFGRQAFPNAYHIIDKFHIIRSIIEQLQAVRIRYRQEELSRRRAAKKNKEKYEEILHINGDTTLQLLARSRGLLFLTPSKWSDHQKQRATLLFAQYPEIKRAYDKVLKIRQWYKAPKGKTTYQKTRDRKQKEFNQIIKDLGKSDIEELQNITYTLKTHKTQILHYFIKKETNAKAEALNQNLQRFINVNYGARNTDFFLFRVKKHFAL